MKAKQPDMNEMLNAYMDGELEARQTVEFKRLLENTPELRAQLRSLNTTRNLLDHLPREEAPDELSQQVRLLLERKALFGEGSAGSLNTKRVGTLLFQKIRAVAAVLALGIVLSLLVYSIVAPVDSGPGGAVSSSDVSPLVPVQGPIRGKLELVCASMPSMDSFLKRSIQFNDLAFCVQKEDLMDQRLYYVSCHRGDIKPLLADLSSVWHQFDETVFYVNTGEFGDMIRIDGASVSQVASLIDEQDSVKRVEHARLESVRNSMRNMTASGSMMASLEEESALPAMPPRPMLTSGEPNRASTSESSKGGDRIELTIVLKQSPK